MSDSVAGVWSGSWRAVGAVALIVLLSPAVAQATWPRMDQGTYVIGTSVALPQDSMSLLCNPAGLATQGQVEARLQAAVGGSTSMAARGGGWSLLAGLPVGPFGVGFALERVADPAPGAKFGPGIAQISRISMGGGVTFDRWLHVGAVIRTLTAQSEAVGPLMTTDLGLLMTPWSWLTFGARVSDLVGATSHALPESVSGIVGPQYLWGWAVRYDDRIRWSFDIGWPNIAPITRFATTFSARIDKQYELVAEYQQTLHNEMITGQSSGMDVRFALLLRWSGGWQGAEIGLLRDMPTGAHRENGAVVGIRAHHRFKAPLWHRAMAWLGVGEAGKMAARARKPRAKHPQQALSVKQLHDDAMRQSLGWKGPLKGKYRREASKVAKTVSAFSSAMAGEQRDKICALLAPGRLRFDIMTKDPPLSIHLEFEREAACQSLQNGELARYVREFGPSHPHEDMATVIPALFTVHGSPFLHLPTVQLRAYAEAVRSQRGRQHRMVCSTYKAARLPADVATPRKQRRYDITIGCGAVADYHIEVIGNRTVGFKVRKFAIRRLKPPR